MKKILTLLSFFLLSSVAYAATPPLTTFQGGTGVNGVAAGSIPFGSVANTRIATSSVFQWDDTNKKLSFTNGSSTAESISGTLYLTGISGTQCLHSTSGVVSGTGSDCGAGGGGTGLSTTSPVADSNLLVYSAAGAGSAYGVATSTLTAGAGLTGSFTQIGSGGSVALTIPIIESSGGTGATSIASNMLVANTNSILVSTSTPTAAAYIATSTTATSTFGGAIQIGATSGNNLFRVTATATSSASITVGGIGNFRQPFDGAGLVVWKTGSASDTGRGVVFNQDSTTDVQDFILATSSCANCTALNIKAFPTGKGIIKIEATGGGTGFSSASAISIDTSQNDTQGVFIKNGTGVPFNIQNSSSATIFKVDVVGNASSTGYLQVTGTATSTFSGPIKSTCFSADGTTCITGSGGTNFFTNSGASTYLSTGLNLGVGTTSPFAPLSVSTTTQGLANTTLFAVASTTNQTLFSVASDGAVIANGTYFQMGSTTVLDTFYCSRGTAQCFIHSGIDNTLAGVEDEVQNSSHGAKAYAVYTLQNDLTDSSGLHYAGWSLNGNGYNDNTFGTGFNVPNLAEFVNSDGATSFATNLNATTTANSSYFNWFINGAATTNEIARLTSSSLLLGTTTGLSSNVGTAVIHPQTNTKNALSITNTQGSTTAEFDTTDNQANVFLVGSSTGQTYLRVTAAGYLVLAGTSTPALTSCGTSPSILNGGPLNFSIQVGSVSATGCTATFPNAPLPVSPVCNVTERTGSITNTLSYTVSTSAVVVTQTGLTGDILDVNCFIGNTN